MPHRHYLLILDMLFGVWWITRSTHCSTQANLMRNN